MILTSKITRKKGQSGRVVRVQCIQCGKMMSRDKAVEKHKSTLPLDHRLRKILKNQGGLYQPQKAHTLLLRILRQTPKVCVENGKLLLPKVRRAKNGKIRSKRSG